MRKIVFETLHFTLHMVLGGSGWASDVCAAEVNMKSVDLGRLEKALTELDDFSRRLALLEAG